MTIQERVPFTEFLRPNSRPVTLAADQDANLVGMRLYGEGPFHRELKPALQIIKKTHFLIKAGDVIYNKLFAWKGTFGIVPPELDGMYVSDKFPTYELDRQKVDETYLKWFFRYGDVWEQARLMSVGSAALSKLTLNPPRFLDLKIPLPELPKQKAIASKIERLALKIAEARACQLKAMNASDSLIWSICENYLSRASSNSERHPLGELVDQERGISYGIVQTGKEVEGGIPTLRAGNLQWFDVALGSVKCVDPAIERSFQRTRLRGNELLLRIRGGVGELAICPDEMVGGNVSREIAVIPLLKGIDPRFAMYMLAAPTSQLVMHGQIRGTAYQGINLKDVRKILLPKPAIDTQRQIAKEIDVLRSKLHQSTGHHTKSAHAIDALLPSILHAAFSGSWSARSRLTNKLQLSA